MGEYAEMAMERDWEAQFHPDEYDYLDGVVIRSSKVLTNWQHYVNKG